MAKKKKRTPIKVASKALIPGRDYGNYMKFAEQFFDKELQESFSSFLKGDVGVRGKAPKKKDTIIDIRERTRIENPAFSLVAEEYGAYNPETIPSTTFDLMKKDPQISAGLAFIKLPIIALPWRIECDDKGIAKFVEYALKKIWRKMVRSMLTSVEYGFASHEKVFMMEKIKIAQRKEGGEREVYFNGNALLYKKIKPHHPDSITIQLDEKDNVVGVTQNQAAGKEVTIKMNKALLFTHDEELGNPFGQSRLTAAYKFWYWKELLYQFMLMYFERRGSPPVVATAPLGSSTDNFGNRRGNLDVALDLAASLLSNSVAALPYQTNKNTNENMWGLDYLLDDKRGEMFIQAINHLDVMLLRALWIPETTVDSGASYGQASIHADLFLMAEKGLITDIEGAVNDQIIPTLVQANFRPNRVCECTVEMESLDFNRKLALKELFIEMMRNMDNMVQIGMRPKVYPDVEKMAKILQIPISALDEQVEIGEPIGDEDEEGRMKRRKEDNDKMAKYSTQKVDPTDGGKTKAVPRRTKRKSFRTRDTDRRNLRPGGKRDEQMRSGAGALSENDMKKVRRLLSEGETIVDIYAPQPDHTGNIPVSEKVRAELMKMAVTDEGLKEIKKALLRMRVWSKVDMIPNYEVMDSYGIVKELNMLPDFYIDILQESMDRKLSEG